MTSKPSYRSLQLICLDNKYRPSAPRCNSNRSILEKWLIDIRLLDKTGNIIRQSPNLGSISPSDRESNSLNERISPKARISPKVRGSPKEKVSSKVRVSPKTRSSPKERTNPKERVSPKTSSSPKARIERIKKKNLCKYVKDGEGWSLILCHGDAHTPIFLEEVPSKPLINSKKVVYIDKYENVKPTVVTNGTTDYWIDDHCFDKAISLHCPFIVYTTMFINNLKNVLSVNGYFYLVWKSDFFPSTHALYVSPKKKTGITKSMNRVYKIIIENGFKFIRLLRIKVFKEGPIQTFAEFMAE